MPNKGEERLDKLIWLRAGLASSSYAMKSNVSSTMARLVLDAFGLHNRVLPDYGVVIEITPGVTLRREGRRKYVLIDER